MSTFQQFAQNKGTLTPGQSISVNKYNVQVERYLSQGGFAHVYLVRTETPVHNTIHHVLKRIAITNDAMVADVKNEVEVMRQLKGHPNIVHLIDATWNRMPNGMFEVFILMEFCSGGGIIDMMNRRLRERLTEAEILQIFVDVCEGVAAMHNRRPALIHRDLKVENILQSSPTSYKLCDFGSATFVASRPPATMQEIRNLEADLNRHTTLQYRAPEMVDPHLRRPIDEKSDVWALGVLLYKLCYYTTPFEEHGPLAILNVQYRIPPYPVYSAQMNSLIASMLCEHGAQRPSVFDLLAIVHGLRGTKSLFQYTIPAPQPLSPRNLQSQSQFQAQIKPRTPSRQRTSNPPSVAPSTPSKTVNAGVQAREKVLEAIAPMRRGRPSLSRDFGSSSPQRGSEHSKSHSKNTEKVNSTNWPPDDGFGAEGDKAWRAVVSKPDSSGIGRGEKMDDAWKPKEVHGKPKKAEPVLDFAAKLWDSFDPSTPPISANSRPLPVIPPSQRLSESTAGRSSPKITPVVKPKNKDAFGDLNLGLNQPTPPTLGEARKLRTGLAVTSTVKPNGIGTNSTPTTGQPSTPSPRPPHLSPPKTNTQSPSQSQPASSNVSGLSWKAPTQVNVTRPSSSQVDGLPAETRFPSLEALDATFAGSIPQASSPPKVHVHKNSSQSSVYPSRSETRNSGTGGLRPGSHFARGHDGVRSQQVTGVAMRDMGLNKTAGKPSEEPAQVNRDEKSRPTLSRKHRSSITINHQTQPSASINNSVFTSRPSLAPPVVNFPSSQSSPRSELGEWLTGELVSSTLASAGSSTPVSPDFPVLRGSPSKRASVIEKSTFSVPMPQEAVTSPGSGFAIGSAKSTVTAPRSPAAIATLANPKGNLVGDYLEYRKPGLEKESDSSSDEGPENVNGYVPPIAKAAETGKQEQKERTRKGRQNSVHDLVDLWGGAVGAASNNPSTKVDASPSPRKRQSTTTPASSSTHFTPSSSTPNLAPQFTFPTSAEPQPNSRPSKQSSPIYGPRSQKPSSAGSVQSPVSSRSRPQSMFIFPVSKSNSDGAPPSGGPSSAGLAPPDDSRPRAGVRRTSISDMVQHYEAIGGKTKPAPPPVATKPSVFKSPPRQVNNNRQHGNAGAVSRRNESMSTSTDVKPLVPNKPPTGSVDHKKARTSPDVWLNDSTTRRISPVGYLDHDRSENAEDFPPPSSPKRPTTSASAVGQPTTKFPSRKSTALEESTRSGDGRSPSPERTYQGVGKLIDQWQKKTAEAESPRSPVSSRPGGHTPKRAGLVSGANRGR